MVNEKIKYKSKEFEDFLIFFIDINFKDVKLIKFINF